MSEHRVHRFRPPMGDNYQYLLVTGDQCMVVDPFDDRRVLQEVADLGLTPVGVLLTHTHWDHVNGVQGVLRAHSVPVYVHPEGTGDVPKDAAVRTVGEGDTIPFGDGEIAVYETLGHHPAHVTFQWAGTLLVGDVLFLAGCGNPSFGGDVDQLFATVWERMRHWDPELRLAWGHDYADKNLRFAAEVDPDNAAVAALRREVEAGRESGEEVPWRTLGEELRVNPFFRCDDAGVIAGARRYDPACGEDPRSVFRALREQRNSY